ncbi:hypothetical protein SAMN05892883_2915 [Jatrophihabitans sp. GAS493]|nr:hypothetical protein SAMN05892883_2915 [Jatrophihabitans sp. GAS493]
MAYSRFGIHYDLLLTSTTKRAGVKHIAQQTQAIHRNES